MAKIRVVLSNAPSTIMFKQQWESQSNGNIIRVWYGTNAMKYPSNTTPNPFGWIPNPDRTYKAIKEMQQHVAKIEVPIASNFMKGWLDRKLGTKAVGIALHGTGEHTLKIYIDRQYNTVDLSISGKPIKIIIPFSTSGGAYSYAKRAASETIRRYGEYHIAIPIYYVKRIDNKRNLCEVYTKLLNIFINNDQETLFKQHIDVIDKGYSHEFDHEYDGNYVSIQHIIDLTPIEQNIQPEGVKVIDTSYIGDAILSYSDFKINQDINTLQANLTLTYFYPNTSDYMQLSAVMYTKWQKADGAWTRQIMMDDVRLSVFSRNRNSNIFTSAVTLHTNITKNGKIVTEVINAVFQGQYDPSSYTAITSDNERNDTMVDIVALQPQYELYVNGRYFGIKTAITSDKTVTYNVPADIPKSALEANKQPDTII